MKQDNFINGQKLSSPINKIVILIPLLVLIGWLFNISLLKSVFPNSVAMNPTTAVLLILGGISLFLIQENRSDKGIKIGKVISLGVVIISFIRLIGFYSSFDIGIDQLLFSSQLQGNRTSPNATVNFILIGLSLLLLNSRKNRSYVSSQLLALAVFMISLLAIIGYVYSATSLYQLSAYLPMRFHTAITFLLLSTGVLLSSYHFGFMSVIMHKNSGGYMARRLIPIAIVVPILVGFLRLEGQRYNLFDPEFGSAIGSISIITISSVLLWLTAKSLNKADSKRKTAEQARIEAKNDLADNEIKYRTLIENAGVVMYTTTFKGEITFASTKAYQLTGYSTGELLGMHYTQFIDTEYLNDVKASYKNQLQNKIKETEMEFCIRTKSGDLKYVEQSAVLLTEDDIPVAFQCIIKDISAKKEMANVVRKYELKLFENQERLQAILDNTTSLIFIKDINGKYLLTNKKFKEVLNVTDDMVIGKTDFDFRDEDQAGRFKATDDEVLRKAKQVELEEVIQMHDGMHTILICKFPLLDAEGKVYGISGIATDISERVKYQQQLVEAKKIAEDAQKLQEQFLANMSHEIRTPMNGIRGMTDLLLETPLNDEQKDFTKTIKLSSDNLLVIINDVLDLSKMQAGKLTIEKIDFTLMEVLDNIKAMFHHRIAKKGLLLEFNVDQAVPEMIKGDPYRLNQILTNLIGNAIKFTSQGSVVVDISIQKQSNDEVVLNFKITDTGIGIETDRINAITKVFMVF
jgi:PAS domain S-box-containing protein